MTDSIVVQKDDCLPMAKCFRCGKLTNHYLDDFERSLKYLFERSNDSERHRCWFICNDCCHSCSECKRLWKDKTTWKL